MLEKEQHPSKGSEDLRVFFKGRTEWGEMIAESLVLAWTVSLAGVHICDSLTTVAFWVLD